MENMQGAAPQPPAAPQAPAPKVPKSVIIAAVVVVGLGVLGGIGSMIAGKVASFATRKAIEAGTGVKIDEKGDVTKVTTKEGTMEVRQDGEGAGKMTFTGEDGKTAEFQFSEGGDAKLPTGFPSDFPVMSGAKVGASWAAEEGGSKGYTVQWTVSGSVADAKAFYAAELVKKGWRVTATTEIEGTVSLVFERGEENAERKDGGWLAISAEDGKTNVSLVLSLQGAQ